MNSQRGVNINQYSSSVAYQKPLSSVSQIQNNSMINIKPLAYPCRYHPDQICQNYCIQQKCFQALCSECIEEHLLHHKKQGLNDLYVKSFKSVRNDCSLKLIKIIDRLLSKLGNLNQPKNPQQMLESSDTQLQSIRILMHEIIDEQFTKIRQSIKHKVSQNFTAVKELNQIHENLIKIINQLKQHNAIISEGIIDHQVNVGESIQKTILLNQTALLQMFQKQSWKYDQKFRNINVEIVFSQNEFRQATLGCLKMGSGNNPNTIYSKGNPSGKSPNFVNQMTQDIGSRLRSRSRSPINDRSVTQNSFPQNKRPNEPNISYPVLHYFETGQNVLHLIDIKQVPQKASIGLGEFIVPAFHASLLSQKTGSIFISGGNVQETEQKSARMSKFSLISNEFKVNFADVKPRSSHTLCQDYFNDCIYILGGYGQTLDADEDDSVTTFQTSVQKVYFKNGTVQQACPSNWGGACIAIMINQFIIKACMQGIQIYDTCSDNWYKVTNVKGNNVDGVICRGAGYSLMGTSSILIYGGYDESQQSRKECFLMNLNLNTQNVEESAVEVQKINATLPIAEGFWNNPGILYQANLWVIQNVQDEEGESVQSERTLLKFDLQQRRWTMNKVASKGARKN